MPIHTNGASAKPNAADPAKIQIYTLGTLQVVRDTKAVTESDWHTRQARQLLKILITERPRPVSTDRLIEILWPESTPAAAATTLRSAINALRNVLEPTRRNRAPSNYIVTETPGYAFCGHPDIWLDVDAFEQLLDQAARTAEQSALRSVLETALDLYKDDYLISDPYADWAQNERERLRERYFTALLQLAAIQAEAGQYAAAITTCRRILARDEVRENAYQALMRYQAESGDSAAALLTYERCRAILSDELGADPSPLTQQWHQRILNGEVEARPLLGQDVNRQSSFAPAESGLAHKLPISVPLPQQTLLPALSDYFLEFFVGREHEIAHLDARLRAALAGQGNLILLEGEAGVGKTRLTYQTLQTAAASGATIISATCQTLERQLPFAPLADAIGRYLYELPDAALRGLPAASLAQLGQIMPSLQDRLPELPVWTHETTLRSDENRQRLIDGIVAFLAALARARPLVFFLDDLHWADADTLAVLSRLSQRLADLPMLIVLAYRSEDLAENEALTMLLHALRRLPQRQSIALRRLNQAQVQHVVTLVTGQSNNESAELATLLYSATRGNPLFVTEALRDLQERRASEHGEEGSQAGWAAMMHAGAGQQTWTLHRNQHVQEIILERLERLPETARIVLHLSAVIGRDFSLELLESAATEDPIKGLETLLQRKFLLERPDERLDFSHQVVRQVAYDNMPTLQRRRLHLRVAEALVRLQRGSQLPGEIAFHYSQAGASVRQEFAHYRVLAAEKLLRTYGFRPAVAGFDAALAVLEAMPESPLELIRRALQGRGLAYESLFEPDGVTDTYRRLQSWARTQGDQPLMLKAHSRLTSILGLLGQQRESNELLRELIETLTPGADGTPGSQVIIDLFERRRLIYSPDAPVVDAQWTRYTPPPPPVAEPVRDILQMLDPIHAVLPLLDYGWTLLVQGQPGAATRCIEAVVDLARETGQPSIASTALHQLAVTARILGHLEQSQALNEQSVAINREIQGAAAELGSMWPRIASAFLSLRLGRVDEAERRLHKVLALLDQRAAFRNHRNSTNIGLGLVALARGDQATAKPLLTEALADPVNLYPYTHVRALLGLAQIAHQTGDALGSATLLRQALHFAGRRSLLEEYVETVREIALLRPIGAPVESLVDETLRYVKAIGLDSLAALLDAKASI